MFYHILCSTTYPCIGFGKLTDEYENVIKQSKNSKGDNVEFKLYNFHKCFVNIPSV